MKIRYFEVGGIRGKLPQQPLEVTPSDLSPSDQRELDELVKKAKQTSCSVSSEQAHPDQQYYRIELDDDDGSTAWDMADSDMPDEVRPLVNWLKQKKKSVRRGK